MPYPRALSEADLGRGISTNGRHAKERSPPCWPPRASPTGATSLEEWAKIAAIRSAAARRAQAPQPPVPHIARRPVAKDVPAWSLPPPLRSSCLASTSGDTAAAAGATTDPPYATSRHSAVRQGKPTCPTPTRSPMRSRTPPCALRRALLAAGTDGGSPSKSASPSMFSPIPPAPTACCGPGRYL